MKSAAEELYILWDVESCPIPEGLQPPRLIKDGVNVLAAGDKNIVDIKTMLLDMLVFALDYSAPEAMIMLMSSNQGFSSTLHTLGNRGYTIILIVPENVYLTKSLLGAGNFVGDWHSLATGKGFFPPIISEMNFSDCGSYSESNDCDNNLFEYWGQMEWKICWTNVLM